MQYIISNISIILIIILLIIIFSTMLRSAAVTTNPTEIDDENSVYSQNQQENPFNDKSTTSSNNNVSSILIPNDLNISQRDKEVVQRLLELPPDNKPEQKWKEQAGKSKIIIRRQEIIISALIIGLIIGQLMCYLSVKSLEEARRALRTAIEVGIPLVLSFIALLYAAVFFFKLDHKWDSFSHFSKSVFLSIMLGVSTVITLIIVPPLLGGDAPTRETIAIGLAFNFIGDVIINTLESFGEKYWQRKNRNKQAA